MHPKSGKSSYKSPVLNEAMKFEKCLGHLVLLWNSTIINICVKSTIKKMVDFQVKEIDYIHFFPLLVDSVVALLLIFSLRFLTL